MKKQHEETKSIWYFVGLLLLTVGSIIFLTGIYLLISSSQGNTVLAELHPDVWWGGFMIVMGVIFLLTNKKVKNE